MGAIKQQQSWLDSQEEKFKNLLESAKAMGEVRDLDELLDFLARQATNALKADRCSIFLIDQDRDEIWSKVSLGERMIRFPKDQGIAGLTISSGAAIVINDAYQDPRFNQDVDRKTGYVTKSLLSVPMWNTEGVVIGCFEVINKKNGDFNENEKDYLQAFANQAAVAIETALLYQRQEKIITDLEITKGDLERKMMELEFVYKLEHASAQAATISEYVAACSKLIIDSLELDGFFVYFIVGEDIELYYKDRYLKEPKIMNLVGLKKLMKSKSSKDFELKDVLFGLNHKLIQDISGKLFRHTTSLPFTFKSATEDQICNGRIELCHSQSNFEKQHAPIFSIMCGQIASSIYRFKLMEERTKAQRFATIGQLSSTIVHDFRNPMTGIRGFAELIQMKGDSMEPRQIQKLCSLIISQVDRCSNMIDELLSFARGEKNFHFNTCPGREFFDQIVEILKVETDRLHVDLIYECHYDGNLVIDRDKMMRAIFNLTNNALEMLEDGDSLWLSVKQVGDAELEIRVRDSGPGVPEEIRRTLFDLFVTQGKSKGTGLGLYITKDIVEAHGGRIYLDETVHDGACFVIRLLVQSLD